MPETKAIYSRNCWLENSFQEATVFFEGGVITAIEKGYSRLEPGITDAGEYILMPGIIDAHVHVNEPGRTEWEGFDTATQAASAGGITTIIDMPLNASPVTTSAEALDEKRLAAKKHLHVNCGFYGGLVPGSYPQLEELIQSGVLGIKCFMVHSGIDEFPNVTLEEIDEALPLLKKYNLPLLVHAEWITDDSASGLGDSPQSYNGYLASRPRKWENDAINLLIDLCRKHRSHIHIVHVSSSEALDVIARAKEEGIPLTAETCSHYIYFDAENIPDGDTRFKCSPPIREKINNDLLRNACKRGNKPLLDFITTDHSPAPPLLKQIASGNLQKAWGGIAGLQFLLPSAWTALRNQLSLAEFIPLITSAPAEFLNIHSWKGHIKKGYDADLTIWSPGEIFTVAEEHIFHRHKITPYLGEKLFGVVKQTFVNGHTVFNDGKIINKNSGEVILKK
jgi:allantoinase